MKKIIPALIIALGIFERTSAQKRFQINAVAFYNLENLFDAEDDPSNRGDDEFTPSGRMRYTEAIYQKKLQNMARVLSEIATDKIPEGPALIGVAEIENERVLSDLVKRPELKDRGWRIVHFESNDHRGIDVGLLYNPKYFKVIDARSLPVVLTANGKKETTRDILCVTGIMSGDTIAVFVNHWPSRRGGEAASKWKRMEAASVCRSAVDAKLKQNPNYKVIIMGDLNDDPTSTSVARILGATDNKARLKPGGLYNPWIAFHKKGLGTLGYGDSWNLFDQIIVSQAFLNKNVGGWQFYRADIFNPPYLKTNFGKFKGYPHRSFSNSTWIDGYSDHFPTYIYLIKAEE